MIIKNHLLVTILATSSVILATCHGERMEKNTPGGTKETDPGPAVEQPFPAKGELPIENTYRDQYGNLIFTLVDQKPAFKGGDQELYHFLAKNLKYPQDALDRKLEGTVHVAFIISKEGSIRNVELAKGVNESSLNKEAMRVVSQMPNWTPGMHKGETVNVKYTLPVKFALD